MKKALLVTDVSHTFMPWGKLAVKDSHLILPGVNAKVRSGEYDVIVAFQDWHPKNHESFETWGEHAVMNTWDGELLFDTGPVDAIFRKGRDMSQFTVRTLGCSIDSKCPVFS